MYQKSKVAILATTPETVIEDYGKLIRLAEYQKFLPKDKMTCLKINVSWQKFFPACSTTPWQLDGVIKAMLEDGYKKELLYSCHNRTVVVDGQIGEILNKQRPVIVDKYDLENIHLQPKRLSDFKKLINKGEWIEYRPKAKLLVLDKIFPHHYIPKRFFGENIIHFPTMKTHIHSVMTGAMKNAFGALLHHERHWAHCAIHETLVDLLIIQKEIFSGIFAVMDATFAGSGAGPRSMKPVKTNLILASGDMVAIDAIAAKIMGFDPLKIKFIKLAHELGLGCGDPNEIEIVGIDISGINLNFEVYDNFASRGQKMIYRGALKPFERFLMKTPIVPWSYLASRAYYDWFWYNVFGRHYVSEYFKTEWGKLFLSYPG